MNFTSFGGHFSTTLPAIHQFAAKFSQDSVSTNICSSQENSNKYTDSPDFPQHVTHNTLISGKFHNNFINQAIYTQQVTLRQEKKHTYEAQELAQGLCAAMIQQQEKQTEKQMKEEAQIERRTTDNQQQASHNNQLSSGEPNINISHSATSTSWQSLTTTSPTVVDYLSQLPASSIPLSLHHFLKYSADNIKKETVQLNTPALDPNIAGLQCTTANVNNINASTLSNNSSNIPPANSFNRFTSSNTHNNGSGVLKKKKKKKTEEEKKPRPKPGEIRLTTALDGSTLYCCPECHMAYPEKELLEQHLIGHTLERRFVCDICGAGLKRKDHLTRHKQSHNPERPYVCTVCLKAFKRKEQLTLHFVIHSGEKRHLCTECGKGFYRKDHLRKHARSHIARRVKAELSQQGNSYPVLQTQVPAPPLHHNSTGIIL